MNSLKETDNSRKLWFYVQEFGVEIGLSGIINIENFVNSKI